MIDSHCHLDCDAFDADRDAVLARARAAGVTDIVIPAVDPVSWSRIRSIASTSPRIHATVGIHPVALPSLDAADDDARLESLEKQAQFGGIVAIGECGLDTMSDHPEVPLDRQRRVLSAQLALARALDLPVILHARGPGAYSLLSEHLKKEQMPARGGVLHSYGGGAEMLKAFLRWPLCFGFAGPATYRNAPKVTAAIAAVPEERLLAETDAPDQTPEPHRPGRSEPAYVAEVIAGLARARATTPERIAHVTTENARRLFRL